jgi:O-antigen/teichoic acid export membrane protein
MAILAADRREMLAHPIRAIRRPGVMAVVVQLGSYAPKAVGLLILGRYLTTDEIGLYGILTAAIALLAIVLPFSGYVARTRPGVSASEVSSRDAVSVRLHVVSICLLAALACLPAGHDALDTVARVHVPTSAYYLTLLIFVFSAFLVLGRTWIQAEFKHVSATVLGNLPDMAWIPVFIALLATTSPGSRLDLALAARLAGTAAVTIYAVRRMPWRRILREPGLPGDVRAVTAFCLPLILVSGAISVAGVLDRIILSRYASLTEVGKYTFMYLLFGMSVTAVIVIHRVAATRAAAQANRAEWPAAKETLRWLALGLFLLPVAAGGLIVALGPVITAVADKPLLPSTATMLLTGLALGLFGVRLAWQTWYQLHYQTRIVGILEFLAAAAYVAFLFLLTPSHRSLGAAAAYVLGNAFGLGVYLFAWRFGGRRDVDSPVSSG